MSLESTSPVKGPLTELTVGELLGEKKKLRELSITANDVRIVLCETYMHRSDVASTAAVVVVVAGGIFVLLHVTVNTNIGAPALHGFFSPSAFRSYIAFITSESLLLGMVGYYQNQIKQIKKEKLNESTIDTVIERLRDLRSKAKTLAEHLGMNLPESEQLTELFKAFKDDICKSSEGEDPLSNSMLLERVAVLEQRIKDFDPLNIVGGEVDFDDAEDLGRPGAFGVESVPTSEGGGGSRASWHLSNLRSLHICRGDGNQFTVINEQPMDIIISGAPKEASNELSTDGGSARSYAQSVLENIQGQIRSAMGTEMDIILADVPSSLNKEITHAIIYPTIIVSGDSSPKGGAQEPVTADINQTSNDNNSDTTDHS